jgi:hypothetical protein
MIAAAARTAAVLHLHKVLMRLCLSHAGAMAMLTRMPACQAMVRLMQTLAASACHPSGIITKQVWYLLHRARSLCLTSPANQMRRPLPCKCRRSRLAAATRLSRSVRTCMSVELIWQYATCNSLLLIMRHTTPLMSGPHIGSKWPA